MPGTRAGGLKAAATNLAKNPNFYREIGRKGGQAGSNSAKGFALEVECNCEVIKNTHLKRQCAGRKGGRISRRNGHAKSE